jgi:hypothetical protein
VLCISRCSGSAAFTEVFPMLSLVSAADLAVWAFGPPGQLASPGLAAALVNSCALTCVVTGEDLVPRASSAGCARLADQCVVGLARLRWAPCVPHAHTRSSCSPAGLLGSHYVVVNCPQFRLHAYQCDS